MFSRQAASPALALATILFASSVGAAPTGAVSSRQSVDVIYGCTVPGTAALTFDDGPWQYLSSVVDTLDAYDAKGTFFFNGNNFACIYDQPQAAGVQYAYTHGHQVASHTWTHPHLASLTPDQIRVELTRIDLAIEQITGARPAFVRPPYGEFNDAVTSAAASEGEYVVIWDFDSGDSAGVSAKDSESSYERLVEQHPSTILALNHEVYASTANELLPKAIKTLRKAGYKLVTVAECVGAAPYQSIGAPSTPDSSWHC